MSRNHSAVQLFANSFTSSNAIKTSTAGMSISAEDIETIRETWKPLAADLQTAGIAILKTFLDKYDYYSYFERFRDHPRETIAENAIFRSHSLNVAKALNEAVNSLEEPERLKDVLTNLGRSHNRKKIRKLQFEQLQSVVLDLLRDVFKLTPNQLETWDRVLTATMSFIFPQLDS